ncbi:MAG TPA: cation:proton antiporter [Candidatus Ozemobacteraceae bacterium]|nr:cation:proton antiporter [Candidatus Ozemobacteraceae bacterium]
MISDIILILIVGLISGIIARMLGQPLFLGYIFAGVVVGPHTGGATVSDIPQIEQLADIGVALLLFSLGLEFSMKDLLPIKGVAIWGSLLQVALTFPAGWLLGLATGWPNTAALWFGASIVSSSTAVILKTLTDRGHLRALSGRVMLCMSIVQDLTVIPIMILLGNVLKSGLSLGSALVPIASTAGFLLMMKLVGTYLTPRLLRFVARWNSRELFMLAIICLGLGLGYITHLAGLSLAFGAFITGLVLNESEYGHKALCEMIPIRDLFSLLFFVSVGMLLDPALLWRHAGTILFLMLTACGGRGLLLAAITALFGYRRIIPVAAFFGMLPISEIAFVVIRTGLAAGAMTADIYSIILNTVILSMLFGPFAAGLASPFYARLRKLWPDKGVTTVNLPEEPLRDHAIIAGGGKLARYVAATLKESGTPFVIIEPLYQAFAEGKSAGLPMIYGEPGQESVLAVAGLPRARLVLFTEGDLPAMKELLALRRAEGLGFRALAKADRIEERTELLDAGFDAVVLPDLEGGLEMAHQSLQAMGHPIPQIERHIDRIRREATRSLTEEPASALPAA